MRIIVRDLFFYPAIRSDRFSIGFMPEWAADVIMAGGNPWRDDVQMRLAGIGLFIQRLGNHLGAVVENDLQMQTTACPEQVQ
jgi:hypothetical protein